MLLVGLTGGIGSGKSTVAEQLAGHGVHVLDADRMAREAVAPGTPGLTEITRRFGPAVLTADGRLDRAALGRVVFDDPAARRDLEAITHPRIQELTGRRLTELPADAIAAHDVPLLVELGYAARYHLVIVVGAPDEVRVARLVRHRGMPEQEAWSRLRTQADDAARRAVADAWLDNSGTTDQLRDAVDRLVARRLLPFHRNLLTGHAVRPEEVLPADAGEDVGSRPARVADRLRYAARLASVVRTGPGREPGWTQARLTTGAGERAATLAALAAAGFVSAGEDELGSCDPGRPARVVLTADEAPRSSR